MVNKVILLGNIGRDPEVRSTQGGSTICNLNLATSRRVKKGDNWENETEWHRVVLFGKTAENAGKYLKKGSTVYIEGRIQTRKWQDKNGQDRYSTEIIGEEMRFVGARQDAEQRDHRSSGRDESTTEPPPYEDVPF